MSRIIDFILLKKEAYLFDAKLYILKAFVAVLAAYMIVQRLPLVHKDMISVLFGLMMTLEPVTVTGIRSGFKQIGATLFGALATAVIILLFGINQWTVALSVSATLFLCLKVDWREVSPVAIFTSIYMTQFVQYTAKGDPSVVLTFLLRILALGVGVMIAVIFNFLFSMFFYKQMERKRIAHILETITDHMKQIKKGIEEVSADHIDQEKELLPGTFNGIDWLSNLIKDKEKEAKLKQKLKLNNRYEETIAFHHILVDMRSITHLVYDTAYMLSFRMSELKAEDRKGMISKLDTLINESKYLATHCENNFIKYSSKGQEGQVMKLQDYRYEYNLICLQEKLDAINETLIVLGK